MSHAKTTRTLTGFPLACRAIKAGKYRTQCMLMGSAKGSHPITAIYSGNLIVADAPSPGEALAWIEQKELANLSGE